MVKKRRPDDSGWAEPVNGVTDTGLSGRGTVRERRLRRYFEGRCPGGIAEGLTARYSLRAFCVQ